MDDAATIARQGIRINQLELALQLLMELHGEDDRTKRLLIGEAPARMDVLTQKVWLVRRLQRYRRFKVDECAVHTCHDNCINADCLLMACLRILEDGA